MRVANAEDQANDSLREIDDAEAQVRELVEKPKEKDAPTAVLEKSKQTATERAKEAEARVGTLEADILVLVGPAVIGPKGLMLASVQPLTTLTNPGIISIPIGFLAGWIGSPLGSPTSDADDRFAELQTRALTGVGAEQSAKHH